MKRDVVLFSSLLAVSATALVIAWIGWQGGGGGETIAGIRRLVAGLDEASRERAALSARLDAVGGDIAKLSRAIDGLRPPPAADAGAAAAVSDRPGAPPAEFADVVRRLEELTLAIEEIGSRPPVIVGQLASDVAGAAETPADRARIVAEAQPATLDIARSPEERVAALRELRFRDGRSLEVTLAMIALIRDPTLAPNLRADIIRNLDGVEFEELKQPLLDVLRDNADSGTRSEAVETLQVFYGDAVVHRAVTDVRDNDPDLRVRLEATERLSRWAAERGVPADR